MMNKSLIFLFLIAISCEVADNTVEKSEPTEKENDYLNSSLQEILDSAGVDGSILIWREGNTYYSNDFDWALKGRLPASTFKIPNSIIALELGIMTDDSTLIAWDGKPRYLKRWEQDLYLKDAFHSSCVPCYQEIARKIGVVKMKHYLNGLNYGSMKFDSTNLDMFWLEGLSEINQYQQIDFLRTFNEQRLPISKRTHTIMRRMMIIEENEQYTLRGKTGWSIVNEKDNCWYVGFLETGHGFYYFATNIEPLEQTDLDSLASIRKTVTDKALQKLGAFN